MRIIRNILYFFLLILTVASCELTDKQPQIITGNGREIVFKAESDWPAVTRLAITDIDDIKSEGFKVWGTWTKDPNDNYYYINNTDVVFGASGSTVSYNNNLWKPDYTSEWYKGYYNFAEILPSSHFNVTYSSTFDKISSESQTAIEYTNQFTIDLGEEGYDLSRSQGDLMYAFANVDNSSEEASTVNLHFNHAFSLIDVKLSFIEDPVYIKEVSIYGIHNSIRGELIYTQEELIVDNKSEGRSVEIDTANNLSELLANGNLTTSTNPYVKYEYDINDFDQESHSTFTIADDLLVFPETLSQDYPLTIQITCLTGDAEKTIYAVFDNGSWLPGKSYTYILEMY